MKKQQDNGLLFQKPVQGFDLEPAIYIIKLTYYNI